MRTQKKKRAAVVAVVAVGLSLSAYGFHRQGAAPDLSSPKAVVRSFVTALIAKDTDALAACVQGATASADLKQLLSDNMGPTAFVTGADVKDIIAEADGDKAKVAVDLTLKAPQALERDGAKITISLVEFFDVQKTGDQWRIVPDANAAKNMNDPTAVVRYELRPFATVAAMVGTPQTGLKLMQDARGRAQGASCLSNEKQLALGVLMYVQDYDEKFPKKAGSYKEMIFPYVKNNDVFQCPSDAKGTISYTLNPNIRGATMAVVASPAQTVLLYEGKGMKFDFKHGGKTAVAFTDGHAKLLTPEEAKNVFWYPEGKTPAPAPKPKPKPRKK